MLKTATKLKYTSKIFLVFVRLNCEKRKKINLIKKS